MRGGRRVWPCGDGALYPACADTISIYWYYSKDKRKISCMYIKY